MSEADVTQSMVEHLTERLFGGDAAALASHLIAEHEIDAEELERLERLIESRQEEG